MKPLTKITGINILVLLLYTVLIHVGTGSASQRALGIMMFLALLIAESTAAGGKLSGEMLMSLMACLTALLWSEESKMEKINSTTSV